MNVLIDLILMVKNPGDKRKKQQKERKHRLNQDEFLIKKATGRREQKLKGGEGKGKERRGGEGREENYLFLLGEGEREGEREREREGDLLLGDRERRRPRGESLFSPCLLLLDGLGERESDLCLFLFGKLGHQKGREGRKVGKINLES